MDCPSCGAANIDSAGFCSLCLKPLYSEPAPSEEVAPVSEPAPSEMAAPAREQTPSPRRPVDRRAWIVVLAYWGAVSVLLLAPVQVAPSQSLPAALMAWLFFSLGLLPALTLRRTSVRVLCGLLSAMAGFVIKKMWSEAAAPNAGLGGLFFGLVAYFAIGVCLALLCVGVAGALSRGIGHVRHKQTPWYVTLLFSGAILGLIFGGPYAVSRAKASMFYSKNAAIVAAARDEAMPHTQNELASSVVDLLTVFSNSQSADRVSVATQGLLELWHPGPLRNHEYFLADPRDSGTLHGEGFGMYVKNVAILPYLNSSGLTGTLGVVRPGDRFTATWSGEVPLSSIDEASRWLLTFYDDTRWKGGESGFRDGKPLFPDGHFYQLDVTRTRGLSTAPFLTVYAVDDHGKWWMVGFKNPYEQRPSANQ